MVATPRIEKHSADSVYAEAITPMPIRILEVELGQALPMLSARDEKTDRYYHQACCVIRLHGSPIGIVELQFDKDRLYALDYSNHIWDVLHEQINEHLRQDNLPAVTTLEPAGLMNLYVPSCIKEREAFLATAPFVSVIVSTRDRTEWLSRCLPALLAQHYPRYEVIIVDNAPGNSTTADLVQQTFGHVSNLRYVREEHPGLSRGLNRGIKVADGEILAFTDDDVQVDTYWLLELVKAFESADDVACVTGLVLPAELETPAQFWFEAYGGFSKGFHRRIYDMRDHRPREPLYPYSAGRFGTGASMAFRADFLRSVGGFDPALLCGMDIAAFFQAIRAGHALVYTPAALAYHTHRRDYAGLRKQIYNYGMALTAYLTKCILEYPLLLLELLTKLPYGLFFTFSPRSPKNSKKRASYPKELTLLELQGMLHGTFDYLRRRRK